MAVPQLRKLTRQIMPARPGDSQSQSPSDMSDKSDWSDYRTVRVGPDRSGASHFRFLILDSP